MARDSSSPNEIRAMTALVIVATFLSGAVAGAGAYHWFAPQRGHPHHPHFGPLAELDLSPEQDTEAKAIMERYRPELEAVMRETFPKVRAVHARIDAELRSILNPAQRAKFEAFQRQHPAPDGVHRFGPAGYPPAFLGDGGPGRPPR
jgi:Spy/CpxP family protein refolding chaperone